MTSRELRVMGGYRDILVAFDSSISSTNALAQSLEFTKREGGNVSTVTVLTSRTGGASEAEEIERNVCDGYLGAPGEEPLYGTQHKCDLEGAGGCAMIHTVQTE